jgi:hypothetical protein
VADRWQSRGLIVGVRNIPADAYPTIPAGWWNRGCADVRATAEAAN